VTRAHASPLMRSQGIVDLQALTLGIGNDEHRAHPAFLPEHGGAGCIRAANSDPARVVQCSVEPRARGPGTEAPSDAPLIWSGDVVAMLPFVLAALGGSCCSRSEASTNWPLQTPGWRWRSAACTRMALVRAAEQAPAIKPGRQSSLVDARSARRRKQRETANPLNSTPSVRKGLVPPRLHL